MTTAGLAGNGAAHAPNVTHPNLAPWAHAWAKTGTTNGDTTHWLPLHAHLADTAATAHNLWHQWAGRSARDTIARELGCDTRTAGLIAQLAAALHDIGKLTPAFAGQAPHLRHHMEQHGYQWHPTCTDADHALLPHTIAGHLITRHHLTTRHGIPTRHASQFATIIAGHHGTPPTRGELRTAAERVGHHTPAATTRPHTGRDALLGNDHWENARHDLITHLIDEFDLHPAVDALHHVPITDAAQALLQAFTITADWVASDTRNFPTVPTGRQPRTTTTDRATTAWEHLNLPQPWKPEHAATLDPDTIISERFNLNHPLNALQREVLHRADMMPEPGLLIIEAVMGGGKTIAGLLAAETIARKFGQSGIFYAMPTRATTNSAFTQVTTWLSNVPVRDGATRDVHLRHSSAHMNDTFNAIPRTGHTYGNDLTHTGTTITPPDGLTVHTFTTGRKKAALADTVAATIDHALLSALASNHVVLRHFGLTRQVVILDEVHAADTWMMAYLERALEWFGRYRIPVIMMSATLPSRQRQTLIDAYQAGRDSQPDRTPTPAATGRVTLGELLTRDTTSKPDTDVPFNGNYPLITCVAGGNTTQATAPDMAPPTPVTIVWDGDGDTTIMDAVAPVVNAGGCALIVQNTVTRAVDTYQKLHTRWGGNVHLSHSRFIAHDRARNDDWLIETFGPDSTRAGRAGRVVIATQVAEQALDIDFDILVTDLAPVDIILQRAGRIHRHPGRWRPTTAATPTVHIVGYTPSTDGKTPPIPDRGSCRVYTRHLLTRTAAILHSAGTVNIPDDVPHLVERCYTNGPEGPTGWADTLKRDRFLFDVTVAADMSNANAYTLPHPGRDTTVGLLGSNVGETGEHAGHVRKHDGGFEVILLGRVNGAVRPVRTVGTGTIPEGVEPSRDVMHAMSQSVVRVPGWVPDTVRESLTAGTPAAWKGARTPVAHIPALFVDAHGTTVVEGHRFEYHPKMGLTVTRTGT